MKPSVSVLLLQDISYKQWSHSSAKFIAIFSKPMKWHTAVLHVYQRVIIQIQNCSQQYLVWNSLWIVGVSAEEGRFSGEGVADFTVWRDLGAVTIKMHIASCRRIALSYPQIALGMLSVINKLKYILTILKFSLSKRRINDRAWQFFKNTKFRTVLLMTFLKMNKNW